MSDYGLSPVGYLLKIMKDPVYYCVAGRGRQMNQYKIGCLHCLKRGDEIAK